MLVVCADGNEMFSEARGSMPETLEYAIVWLPGVKFGRVAPLGCQPPPSSCQVPVAGVRVTVTLETAVYVRVRVVVWPATRMTVSFGGVW
jgi:hypothetical protein